MSPFEIAWRRRVNLGGAASFIAIFLYAAIYGPIDRPGEAILAALLALSLGFFIGLGTGRYKRRFVPYIGPGPRISQSSYGKDPVVYRSYDTTETPFEMVEPALGPIALLALAKAPFIGRTLRKRISVPDDWRSEWAAVWLFQTQDSLGRPVFLDEQGLLALLENYPDAEKSSPLGLAISEFTRLQNRISLVEEEASEVGGSD